jgi:putative membrane protein
VTEAANNGEVAQGKLAEQKATKQAAKSFANMMVADHDAANKKIEALSKELGMDPKDSAVSAEVKSSGDAVQRKLNQSATGAFDHVYLQSQINEHEKVLKTFDEQLIPAASSPKLKSLLGDLRAHVAHHLAVAKSALATIDKAG